MIAFLAGLANIFLRIPVLHLAVSGAFILVSAGFILFETSNIMRSNERNYISATITLYVAIYNIFVSLLSILGLLAGRRD